LIGAIIGDIVGSRFDFDNHRSKDFELFTDECFVTDDSIMTLAIAKAIMEAEKAAMKARKAGMEGEKGLKPPLNPVDPIDDYSRLAGRMAVKYMQEIGRKYPNCGYGRRFATWVFSDDPQPYNSFGNGAAMRISPVGFAARTEFEACKLARAVTEVTHNHEEGIKGAEAVAVVIYMVRHGFTKGEIREKITHKYYPLDFTLDGIRDTYRFNETCQETVPQAIQAFLESASFEDAIRNAISLGGDSDTLAAITGSIAEAYYGVPEELKQKAFSYLDDELRAIFDEWVGFIDRTY
jgi:ADP-ribosylglycohydrolase